MVEGGALMLEFSLAGRALTYDHIDIEAVAGLHASKGIQLNTHYFWQNNYIYMYMLCIEAKYYKKHRIILFYSYFV